MRPWQTRRHYVILIPALRVIITDPIQLRHMLQFSFMVQSATVQITKQPYLVTYCYASRWQILPVISDKIRSKYYLSTVYEANQQAIKTQADKQFIILKFWHRVIITGTQIIWKTSVINVLSQQLSQLVQYIPINCKQQHPQEIEQWTNEWRTSRNLWVLWRVLVETYLCCQFVLKT